MRRLLILGVAGLALGSGAITPSHAATNLIRNGSFERPMVPAGGLTRVSTGEKTIPHWAVVGAPGTVDVISGTFTQDGFQFPARAGAQFLDLTGNSNTATGVQQTVATTAGNSYDLTFFVGSASASGGFCGTNSTVNVYVNNKLTLSAVNNAGGTTLKWKKFSTTITATNARTVIGFINGDPGNDTCNGLDAVSLVPLASPSSGEPGTEPSLFAE